MECGIEAKVYKYIRRSVHTSVSLTSIRRFAYPSVRLFVGSSVRWFVCPSVRLSVGSFVSWFVCPSARLFIDPLICLSVQQFVYLSVCVAFLNELFDLGDDQNSSNLAHTISSAWKFWVGHMVLIDLKANDLYWYKIDNKLLSSKYIISDVGISWTY